MTIDQKLESKTLNIENAKLNLNLSQLEINRRNKKLSLTVMTSLLSVTGN